MAGSVKSFRGEYGFLSNMYAAKFEWDGRTYLNSEAAFQSAKSLDPEIRDEFSEMSGVIAKRAGRKVSLRADWEDVKDSIMEEVVRAKFSQNPELLKLLTDTGDMELVEGNRWHDTYWGVDMGSGKGDNHLGIILMKIRSELGGTEYAEKALQLKKEKEAAELAVKARRDNALHAITDELERFAETDLTGMEMNTKAFGRVKILSHEGDSLKFEARGAVKTFMLPDCITLGFLIPDDPAIVNLYQERQRLIRELSKLRKENGGE